MARVCDKALLLFVAFGYRPDYAAGEVADHSKDYKEANKRHEDARLEKIPERFEHPSAVEEGDTCGSFIFIHRIPEFTYESFILSGRERLLRHFPGLGRIDRRYPLHISPAHLAVTIERDNEESGLLRLIARHRRAAGASSAEERTVIFIHVESIVGIVNKPQIIDVVTNDVVLFVELLMLMKQLLQSKYNVLTASNGGEALQIVHKKPVDLIVSDVMMPGINGYELTSALKQDEKFDHLPIILLTAKVQEEDRMDALTAGADDIIAKPFKMRELQLRIDNIIANRQRVLSDSTSNELDITDMAEQKPLTGDQEYLQRAIRCINENISDADYDRNAFAADMSSSVSTLYNKIRALTGKNVTTFVRDIRIKTACRLAKEDPDLRVSDIAYRVGFRDPKYFATSFKRVMGTQPKEYFDHLRGVRDEISKVPQT